MIMNNKMQDFEGICLEKFCSLYECLVLIIHNLQFYFQTCTGKSKDYEHIQHEFWTNLRCWRWMLVVSQTLINKAGNWIWYYYTQLQWVACYHDQVRWRWLIEGRHQRMDFKFCGLYSSGILDMNMRRERFLICFTLDYAFKAMWVQYLNSWRCVIHMLFLLHLLMLRLSHEWRWEDWSPFYDQCAEIFAGIFAHQHTLNTLQTRFYLLFLMTMTVSHPGLWRTRKDQDNFPRPCLITPVLFCPGPGETRSDADWLINMMMVLLFITLYILTAEYYSQQFIIPPWDMTMSR